MHPLNPGRRPSSRPEPPQRVGATGRSVYGFRRALRAKVGLQQAPSLLGHYPIGTLPIAPEQACPTCSGVKPRELCACRHRITGVSWWTSKRD